MTKIFIDNNWQEYDYNTLYSERGYTNTPSTMLVVYDNSMKQLEGWSNTGFNWIEQDHQWYPNDETPYYVQQSSSISLYKINEKTNFKTYLNNNEPFIIYNNSFTTVETLHDNLGYTETPSTVWGISDGVPWSWYNSDTEEYWNNKTHEWTTNPPKEEDEGEPEVLPNPMPLVEVDYSYDMDEPLYLGNVVSPHIHYPQKSWVDGDLLQLVNSDPVFDNLIAVYKDELDENLLLYVINFDGVDFQGVHYNYGDSLSVDRFTVMVDPIGEDTFYYQDTVYSFSYLYDSLSPIIKHYWKEGVSRYYTEEELLELGYSKTPFTKVYATNSDQQIQDIIELWYNEDHGYFYNGVWYLTEQELNNAGYYLLEKVTQTVYAKVKESNWYGNQSITRNSTSFNTTSASYNKQLYLDSDCTTPYLWNGEIWLVDLGSFYQSASFYVDSLAKMPTSTTGTVSSRTELYVVLTPSGNPSSQFISSDLGQQLKIYKAFNYTSSTYVYYSGNISIVLYYYKYPDRVLSFANTQLPDIIIDLPQSITTESGSTITLPTMSGEYESGGKTWTPTAWDIGAFGSSYTLNVDTVAHLIFEEVQQYDEIKLYLAGGQKNSQGGITSSFKGNVGSEYVYPLYTDSGLTTRFVYDYSNDYEVGYYVSGVWEPKLQHVSDMPSSSAEFKLGYILLDVGSLWFVCSGSSVGISFNSITVRIRKKDQQQYPLYFALNSNIYNNYSTSGGTSNGMQHRPGNISYGWMPWSDSFPERTIVNALYSSGKSGVSISRLSFDGTDEMRIGLASGYAPSFRNVIFTLDVPTYTSWANLSGNKSAESNEVCPLFDRNGEYVVYDPMMNYTIIGLFNYSGGHPFNSPNRFMLDAQLGAFDTGNPTRLCFKLNREVTFSYVWYIKTPI